MGVKLVSFGFAGQGRAIMRGPMVSGVINQLLTTTEWFVHFHKIIDFMFFQETFINLFEEFDAGESWTILLSTCLLELVIYN